MEKKMRYYSLILAAICIVIFLFQSANSEITDAFMLTSSVVSRPWILVTSIFLHGSASHLIFNMFALVLFGLLLEKFIGSRKFLMIFFASGLVANIAASLVYPASLGASGAVYGIIGALAAIRPKMIVWTYGVPMPMVAAAGFYLILDLAGMFFPSNIANAAHIAGLLVGAAAGMALREQKEKQKIPEEEKILSEKNLEEWENQWM